MKKGFSQRSLEERFWSCVAKAGPDECWVWTGTVNKYGYGKISKKRPDGTWRPVSAHRLSWELANGRSLTPEEYVCHKCDNPPCVNPGHLFLGTFHDNMQDMVRKRRQPWGERSGAAKLNEQKVAEIRARRAAGERNKDLAKEYGVDSSAISFVTTGRNWKGGLVGS